MAAMAAAFALRVLTAAILPLTDNTEARYATIALAMHESGDWVTPRVRINWAAVPYLGKPPLHFWLTAAAYSALGENELASRLPSLLECAAMVLMTGGIAGAFYGTRVGIAAGAILASAALFYFSAGIPAPDVSLATAVTAAMCSFLLSAGAENVPGRWLWGLAFFASLGTGVLAKGPVAVAIAVLALAIYGALTRRWRTVLGLPWISGGLLFLLVAVPWYLLAERANPGFLRYFIVNENLLRFLTPNYGDRYGLAHDLPYAVTWLYLAALFLPWSGLAWIRFASEGRMGTLFAGPGGELNAYFLAWGLAPALFFTFSSHALAPYVLPGFAGMAAVTAALLVPWLDSRLRLGWQRGLEWLGWGGAVLLVGLTLWARKNGAAPVGIAWLAILGLTGLAVLLAADLLRDGAMAVLAIALAAVLLMTGGMLALERTMSAKYSAKMIVESVGRDRFNPAVSVNFVFLESYSGDFYSRRYLPRGLDRDRAGSTDDILRRMLDRPGEAVILPVNQWWGLSLRFKTLVTVTHRAGRWMAIRSRLYSGRQVPAVLTYMPPPGER
jgi:4-amino-4-deoxy-L-arabinose transferase-like glycosyltransferase